MSAKTPEGTKTNSGTAQPEEKEGGLLPAILAGAGILAVVGLLVFGPSGKDDEDDSAKSADAAGAVAARGAKGAAASRGGIAAREVDDPARRADRSRGKLNPAVKLPPMGMAPEVPAQSDEPPDFASVEEEIAWYERKLDEAERMLDYRKKFAERLPQVREKLEKGDNPEQQLAAFESRKKQVEENYEKAQARVEEIEAKLSELKGR